MAAETKFKKTTTRKSTSPKKASTKNPTTKTRATKNEVTNNKKTISKKIINFIKNHKIIIIGVFLAILVFIMIYSTTHYSSFERIKKRIDNKETFVIVIANDELMTDSDKKMLDYYKDVYDFKYTYIDLDEWPPTAINKLIKITKSDKETFVYPYFLYIEKGQATVSSNNVIGENAVKIFLLNAGVIDEEYAEEDYLLNDDEFENFIKNKNGSILFYGRNDKNIYKYRKELLKIKAKVSIIYAERLNNQETEAKLRNMLKLPRDKEFDLPMLIKFKSGKVIDYKDNITINRVAKEYKDLEKK